MLVLYISISTTLYGGSIVKKGLITFHSLNIIQTFQIQKVSDDIYFWKSYHNHRKIQTKWIKHVKFRDSSMLKMQADMSYCCCVCCQSNRTVLFQ